MGKERADFAAAVSLPITNMNISARKIPHLYLASQSSFGRTERYMGLLRE